MKKIFVVQFKGHFGFIKPWTAVRDELTFSQQFLSPSTIEGMEKKLFPELLLKKGLKKIKRYKLSYSNITEQQETTQAPGWEFSKKNQNFNRNRSILTRGYLLYPTLHLGFKNIEDAQIAASQHLCLCRNEDLIFPSPNIESMTIKKFNKISGFEFVKSEDGFLAGFNRFNNNQPMNGKIEYVG